MFNEKLFKATLLLKGLTIKDVANHLGINEVTMYRKIKRDGDFSRKEIKAIVDYLGIADPIGIFFAK